MVKIMKDRFKELIKKIKSDEFYNNRGLANEVPFYIFDYNPKYELKIRDFVKNKLLASLEDDDRLKAVEIDIFELLLESMRNDNILEMAFEIEEKKGTKFLYEKLKKSFNTEIIMKYISEKTKGKNFLILTGVGKIFPIVRTHTILNNLQNIFDHTKVLLFFPGEYTSTDLSLFAFEDNNYYRAFKI
ncbi:DUF1788 domain-containing protein [Fusobacterium watanabei]|uniref:DUF1788 domain-containing protein n=1 Tax=Fusobacterium watanabei TaxID=2686067 RepID=UPI003B5870E8